MKNGQNFFEHLPFVPNIKMQRLMWWLLLYLIAHAFYGECQNFGFEKLKERYKDDLGSTNEF